MRTSRTAMAVLMLLAGLSVGLVAKSGAGKQAGIIPVADILTASRDEQLEDWETLILDEEVPLVPGPGMLGTESGAAAGYAPPVIQESPYVRRVVALVNEERTKAGLLPLEKSDEVSSAAAVRAQELPSSFSHTRPDGSAYRTVLEQIGIRYRSCGENVAYGYSTPEAVMSAWMGSEGHRDNILNEGYTNIGVGYFMDSSGLGYWTQIFTIKK